MGALDGILVVAIEQAVAAPLCTVRLADAGARVIKIERAGGETARHYDTTVQGTSAHFTWLNRGKESVVADLKSISGMALLHAMLAKADVLVQNLAPGALARLGLTPEVIAQDFPQLIAVSILGYGLDTDYAQMKAYDLLVQAESGICDVTGPPDAPSKVGSSVADIATGSNAHAAILEALIARGKTSRGQSIEISMFDSMADWMAVPLLHYEQGGLDTPRHGMAHATIYPYRPFVCCDGTIIIAVQTNGEWVRLCAEALGRPDLAGRADFATNPLRSDNRVALAAELEPLFAAYTLDDAIARCTSAGVAWARYTQVQDLGAHPALRRWSVELADGEQVSVPRPAGRSVEQRNAKLPALGQHTQAVLDEFTSQT